MQKKWKIGFKHILNIALVMCLVLINLTSTSMAISDKENSKKAIILILDEIGLEEILNSNTPSMDLLIGNGSIGFMNTRTKSRLSNKGSAYLSLGMGVRTLASTQGGLALERNEMCIPSDYNSLLESVMAKDLYKLYTGKNPPDGEIINLAIGDIEKTALQISPNNQVGLLGKVAREENLVIGAIGNSDDNKLSREVTMLAMDEKGIIPFGSVGSDLLIGDPDILGGIRLNQDKLLEEVDRILPQVDILFVDYGDTTRIERSNNLTTDIVKEKQKNNAIERADKFLGQVIEKVDLEETLFMVITPNPSKEMSDEGNFALTPIIMSGANMKKGLLTSNTTNREGLVTNFDFGPTIFNYFNIVESNNFIGESMEIINHETPTEVLLENQGQFLYLRQYRKVFHWVFIILVGITLLGLYLPQFTKWKGLSYRIYSYLCFTIMAIPLTMMTVSLFGYKSIIFDLFYVFGGAFIIVYILDKLCNEKLKIISILGLTTSIFLLIDIFFLKRLMIISPLGSDAIAGGRFYGIGNDYMGILLGSTLIGMFSLFHIYKTKRKSTAIFITLYMSLVIIGLSPFFGANMGGTLSASLILMLTFFIIFEKKISFKSIIIVIIGVFMGIMILAGLDASFNPNPTHAGKALSSLVTDGWSKFYEIISIKLGQVLWNLINASWNIILFLQIVLTIFLYKFKNKNLVKIRGNYPSLFKGFIIILTGGLIVFLFNDTGTIASALMLIYLFIPLGILMNDKKEIK